VKLSATLEFNKKLEENPNIEIPNDIDMDIDELYHVPSIFKEIFDKSIQDWDFKLYTISRFFQDKFFTNFDI